MPQVIMFTLMLLSVMINIRYDGKPRTGTYSALYSMLGFAINFGLLYWGGFFNPAY